MSHEKPGASIPSSSSTEGFQAILRIVCVCVSQCRVWGGGGHAFTRVLNAVLIGRPPQKKRFVHVEQQTATIPCAQTVRWHVPRITPWTKRERAGTHKHILYIPYPLPDARARSFCTLEHTRRGRWPSRFRRLTSASRLLLLADVHIPSSRCRSFDRGTGACTICRPPGFSARCRPAPCRPTTPACRRGLRKTNPGTRTRSFRQDSQVSNGVGAGGGSSKSDKARLHRQGHRSDSCCSDNLNFFQVLSVRLSDFVLSSPR